jgi:hypothetical protein
MRTSRLLTLILAGVLSAVLLTGCFGAKTPKPEEDGPPLQATTTVEPSSTAEATAPAGEQEPSIPEATGPITTPAVGSAVRTALMDALRKRLGTSGQFVVNQLFVQDGYAIGDVKPATGGDRLFVVWTGQPPQAQANVPWSVAWSSRPGKSSSSAARKAVPGLSDALVQRFDWDKTFPPTEDQLRSQLKKDAVTWSKSLMTGKGQPYSVHSVKMKRSESGTWYATVVVNPHNTATEAYESIWFWCKYTAGKWTGEPVTGGDDRDPNSYFPTDVQGALGPF